MKRLHILTGVKPTGEHFHIGNYFGAIAPILRAQSRDDTIVYLFLANMHALTAVHNAEEIKKNSINIIKTYMACGIDPDRTIIFNPAGIPAHAECAWILGCLTNM